MVFSSIVFLIQFLPCIILIYFIAPRRMRNFVLFIGSLFFYAWGEPIYVLLMMFSTISDYIHGRIIGSSIENNNRKKAKGFLISSIIINLFVLGFFKYADFLIITINQLTGMNIPVMNLPLPIGISFYTFQTMSYSIDIYRQKAKVQKNFISFGTFVTLFPQLIAGPIVTYQTIDEELRSRRESIELVAYGLRRFIIGLGKKVLIANGMGELWISIQGMGSGEMTVVAAWVGIISFAFQIYFDFSGYSDMAIGLGSIFGFHFPENFRYPYMATSVTDFWRRWHISLSSWFKEYVYIPLGGNRTGLKRQIINIFIVWSLTGIWHGASLNFLFWGLWFGTFLMIEKMGLLTWLEKRHGVVQRSYTLFIVLISWTIFSFLEWNELISYLGFLFGTGKGGLWNNSILYLIRNFGILLIVAVVGSTDYPRKIICWIQGACGRIGLSDYSHKSWVKGFQIVYILLESICLMGITLLSIAYIVDATYNPFLYFRF